MDRVQRYERIVQNARLRQYEPRPAPRCPLADDWRGWSSVKCGERMFMSCPSCKVYGSHVGMTR